ncbi:DHH family phosphoesterase [Rhodohalobacter sp. 614A]|uniref:DHH family phosphoesterase n=1 Tax=Rhodohalobacter sp. 614A TaxID=2908649 RepID=UPI001F1E70E1|nr:bifunctional oligoribonuclease/PAP phosphatase NrnA [Rhodohalobacter sp. 614A]
MFSEFIEKIKNYNHIGVLSHVRPDGDCLGSQVAISKWLQKNGYTVSAFNDDEIPLNLQWLTQAVEIEKPTDAKLDECDLFIMVDGNAIHRFGQFSEWVEGKSVPMWMIDHHPNPADEFDITISVDDASSTCELIYGLYEESDPNQIDSVVAKALYTGIITDTGSLQFESVTPRTVAIVSDLLARGNFRPNEVIEVIYSNKTLPQMRLLSLALETIQLFEDNQIAVMSVTKEMLEETGTTNADCEGFVSYPLSIAKIKAAVLVKDFYDEGIRISLRSRSAVDVNVWARQLGGGGHKKAAGAWHEGPREKAIEKIIEIGAKQLKDIEAPSVL